MLITILKYTGLAPHKKELSVQKVNSANDKEPCLNEVLHIKQVKTQDIQLNICKCVFHMYDNHME
jgi:hypothetical protein